MNLPIPPLVIYVGLAGTLLSLFVATAQQKWQCRVFFLLALRLAIGWHFLFEGLYKVHSHTAGPNDTTKAFTSEPYFKVAPGPLGSYMRKQFDDPEANIAARVAAPQKHSPADFKKLSAREQAEACPKAVAEALDAAEEGTQKAIKAKADDAVAGATTSAGKELETAKTDEEKAKVRARAAEVQRQANEQIDRAKDTAADLVTAAKATYARWVYGADGRDTKVKNVEGDVRLTAPQRLARLEELRRRLAAAEAVAEPGLGNGYGHASKMAAELRADLMAAEGDLAKDANDFVAELKTGLTGLTEVERPATSRGKTMDQVTMWFLVAVGAMLLAGLLTPLACVGAAGFLVLTYLNHPAFPWYPLPPNTEGNPVFVNKNVIECIALLALACMPTGRWMGLDALLFRNCCRGESIANPKA